MKFIIIIILIIVIPSLFMDRPFLQTYNLHTILIDYTYENHCHTRKTTLDGEA